MHLNGVKINEGLLKVLSHKDSFQNNSNFVYFKHNSSSEMFPIQHEPLKICESKYSLGRTVFTHQT